uniref:Vomeronasal type-1 receptor n=1 Tax=Leptobrachium leishanense TaxID=445787 RepID=A0A8C5MJW7_9ANUR
MLSIGSAKLSKLVLKSSRSESLTDSLGFFLLLMIGILGNLHILLNFAYIKIIEKKLLPTNIIHVALSLANLVIIVSRILLQFLKAIGVQHLLDDTMCKIFVYSYRVSRAMSICMTSLLSIHQSVLIAPNSRLWSFLKQQIAKNILVIIILILLINLIIYRNGIMHATSNNNSTTSPYTLQLVYCYMVYFTYHTYIVNGATFASRDFLFVGMMAMASSYIVYALVRHAKSIKGKRSSDKVQGRSAEFKASRAVILLVTLYVLLFGFDNSMWIYTLTLTNVRPDMNEIRIALACSYSALSPIVIIATNPKLQQWTKLLYSKVLYWKQSRNM